MLKFDEIINNFRNANNLTQNDIVDMLTLNPEFFGVDCGTISRWENKVVTPSFKRIIEILNILKVNFFDPSILEFMHKYELDNNFNTCKNSYSKFFFNTEYDILDMIFEEKKSDGFIYIVLYDKDRNPIAQLRYRLLNKIDFWNVIRGRSNDGNSSELSKSNRRYIFIDFIFSPSFTIVSAFLFILINKLITNNVDMIAYAAFGHKNTLFKFLKSIGFCEFNEEENIYALKIDYFDVCYSKKLLGLYLSESAKQKKGYCY